MMITATTAPQDIARQEAASFEVYRRLRNDIVTCKLRPYDKLRFESLRSDYGAGIGTLREALSHLVSDGLVRTEAGRGFFVAPVSATDLIDITEWRVEFETRATLLSIKNGDDNWEANIVSAFHLMARAGKMDTSASPDALSDLGEKHRRFHDALVAACGSPWLLYFRGVLFDQALRYQALAVMSQGNRTHRTEDDHRAIMDAALNRDAATSAQLVEEHIRETTETVLRNLPAEEIPNGVSQKSGVRGRRKLAAA